MADAKGGVHIRRIYQRRATVGTGPILSCRPQLGEGLVDGRLALSGSGSTARGNAAVAQSSGRRFVGASFSRQRHGRELRHRGVVVFKSAAAACCGGDRDGSSDARSWRCSRVCSQCRFDEKCRLLGATVEKVNRY